MSETTTSPILTAHGVVERGAGRGHLFGCPTANIAFFRTDISGTYAGLVLLGGQQYEAAVYADQKRQLLEAHLFHWEGDLYGQELTVTLLTAITPYQPIKSDEALREKIATDLQLVRTYFGHA